MSYRPGSASGEEAARIQTAANEPLSLIDRFSSIEGTFTTSRDARVEGVVRGKVQCQGLLYIAEGADIDATVEAASVTVAGKLSGEVNCAGKFQIKESGRVTATVTTESLVIDEGAFFQGDLNMQTSSGGSAAARPAPAQPSREPSVLRRFSNDDNDDDPQGGSRRGSGAQ
jgi:cytoskeletal protein CcmA (bactofilin family)